LVNVNRFAIERARQDKHPSTQMVAQPATSTVPPPEVIEVDSTPVGCDGGGGALGHPLIYIPIGADGSGECGYCDRKFVLKAGARASGGH
jgi:uncharacterized Zn-finger protein